MKTAEATKNRAAQYILRDLVGNRDCELALTRTLLSRFKECPLFAGTIAESVLWEERRARRELEPKQPFYPGITIQAGEFAAAYDVLDELERHATQEYERGGLSHRIVVEYAQAVRHDLKEAEAKHRSMA